MIGFALLGVVAGLDNLQVAAAVSTTPLPRARRLLFALACVVCEVGAPMLGAVGVRALLPFDVAPLVVAACGLAIIGYAFTERILHSPLTLVAIPLSLSFDNLLLGVAAGAHVRRWIPEKIEIVSGVYLVAVAATMWLGKD